MSKLEEDIKGCRRINGTISHVEPKILPERFVNIDSISWTSFPLSMVGFVVMKGSPLRLGVFGRSETNSKNEYLNKVPYLQFL